MFGRGLAVGIATPLAHEDLAGLAIRSPIRVVAVRLSLVESPLVITLELVIQNDTIDMCAAPGEFVGLA